MIISTVTAVVTDNTANQDALRNEGGIPILIRLLAKEDEPKVQEEAANVLAAAMKDHKVNQVQFHSTKL